MRIALVEPSRTMRKAVALMLEAGGHEVFYSSDGQEALNHIGSDAEIGALITSAELPSMSGLELCWETRLLANQGRPIYILLMSSNYDQCHLVEALDGGADDFISKPPLAEELYARLRAAERFVSLQRELVRMATTDPLTGVFNRRAFFEKATGACRRVARDKAVSAIIIDIDHFKRINDTYGHDTGDEAIRVCAHALTKNAIVGRLGGDEFAIVLERCSLSQAIEAAKELRLRLAERPIETGTEPITLTCSVGVSEAEPGDTIDQLLQCADIALYEAKVGGRDRVVGAHAALLKARCSNTPKTIVRASDRQLRTAEI